MRQLAAIVLLFSFGCADSKPPVPRPPVQPGPAQPQPGPEPPPQIVRIEISGPESIAPGRSAQFSAVSRLSDGSSQALTNTQWFFSNELVRVDAAGLATAGAKTGEGVISVRMTTPSGFMTGSKTILALPYGTYRIAGIVTEQGIPAAQIVGARVEMTNDTRITSVTGADGRYRLYGVPSNAEIRITRDGYQPQLQRLQLTAHGTQDFELTLAGARLDLAGSYTLAIDVECGSTSTPVRPLELRRRSYAALLTQSGSTLQVVLTESSRFRVNVAGRGNKFTGHADAVGATFHLQSFFSYYYPYDTSTYPDLLERVPDGTFLQIDGTAMTRTTPAGLSGEMVGGVVHYSAGFPKVAPGMAGGSLGTCGTVGSPPHRFTLTRR